MKKNISNRLALTVLCMLVSTFFAGCVTVYAAENVKAGVPATFTISYDKSGAYGEAPSDDAAYLAGDSAVIMEAEALSKGGNTFLGWSETPNGTKADYAPGDIIKIQKNVTLYAVWASGQAQEPAVIISNSGKVCHTQMGAPSESFFPDRTFIAGN